LQNFTLSRRFNGNPFYGFITTALDVVNPEYPNDVDTVEENEETFQLNGNERATRSLYVVLSILRGEGNTIYIDCMGRLLLWHHKRVRSSGGTGVAMANCHSIRLGIGGSGVRIQAPAASGNL